MKTQILPLLSLIYLVPSLSLYLRIERGIKIIGSFLWTANTISPCRKQNRQSLLFLLLSLLYYFMDIRSLRDIGIWIKIFFKSAGFFFLVLFLKIMQFAKTEGLVYNTNKIVTFWMGCKYLILCLFTHPCKKKSANPFANQLYLCAR